MLALTVPAQLRPVARAAVANQPDAPAVAADGSQHDVALTFELRDQGGEREGSTDVRLSVDPSGQTDFVLDALGGCEEEPRSVDPVAIELG